MPAEPYHKNIECDVPIRYFTNDHYKLTKPTLPFHPKLGLATRSAGQHVRMPAADRRGEQDAAVEPQ